MLASLRAGEARPAWSHIWDTVAIWSLDYSTWQLCQVPPVTAQIRKRTSSIRNFTASVGFRRVDPMYNTVWLAHLSIIKNSDISVVYIYTLSTDLYRIILNDLTECNCSRKYQVLTESTELFPTIIIN